MTWLCVHVFFLIGFRNRLLVMFEWAWAWLTYQRVARVVPEGRRPGAKNRPLAGHEHRDQRDPEDHAQQAVQEDPVVGQPGEPR